MSREKTKTMLQDLKAAYVQIVLKINFTERKYMTNIVLGSQLKIQVD